MVILEKDDYDSKIETILKDISTYKELNSDPTESYVAKLRKDLEDQTIKFTLKIIKISHHRCTISSFRGDQFAQEYMVCQKYIKQTFL